MYLSEHVSESLPRDINAVSSKKGIIAFELTKPEAKGSSKRVLPRFSSFHPNEI